VPESNERFSTRVGAGPHARKARARAPRQGWRRAAPGWASPPQVRTRKDSTHARTGSYMAGTPSFLCATNHGVGGAMPCSTCASRYKSALRTSTSLYPPRSTRRGGAASDGSSAAIDM
jgi:hypothetical protein